MLPAISRAEIFTEVIQEFFSIFFKFFWEIINCLLSTNVVKISVMCYQLEKTSCVEEILPIFTKFILQNDLHHVSFPFFTGPKEKPQHSMRNVMVDNMASSLEPQWGPLPPAHPLAMGKVKSYFLFLIFYLLQKKRLARTKIKGNTRVSQ